MWAADSIPPSSGIESAAINCHSKLQRTRLDNHSIEIEEAMATKHSQYSSADWNSNYQISDKIDWMNIN